MPRCATCAEPFAPEVLVCAICGAVRYASFVLMLADHVLQCIGAGLADPVAVLAVLQAKPIAAYRSLTLANVVQQMRLLTVDTTAIARQIAKARAASIMLDVLEHGDTKDKLAILKGTQVLGDVVEHRGEVTTRFVVETHDGPPPQRALAPERTND